MIYREMQKLYSEHADEAARTFVSPLSLFNHGAISSMVELIDFFSVLNSRINGKVSNMEWKKRKERLEKDMEISNNMDVYLSWN
jgi:hypothetical protein